MPASVGFAVSLLVLILGRMSPTGFLLIAPVALGVVGTIVAYLNPDWWTFSSVAVCGGVAFAVAVNAFTDPTMDHNLFPIEVVMLTAIAAVPVFAALWEATSLSISKERNLINRVTSSFVEDLGFACLRINRVGSALANGLRGVDPHP